MLLYGACILKIYRFRSEPPQNVDDLFGDAAFGSEVISFLLLFHPFGGQNHEDGLLEEEVPNQNAAKFIVVPLFRLRINLALRLIEFSHILQAFFVSVVPDFVLQKRLVKVEAFWSEFGWMAELFKQPVNNVT